MSKYLSVVAAVTQCCRWVTRHTGVQNLQVHQVQSSIDLSFTCTDCCVPVVCLLCACLPVVTDRGIFSALVWWSPWQLLIEQSKTASLLVAAAAAGGQAGGDVVWSAHYLLPGS